ncbi:MAG: tripartite tricarboxylate transporter substrate binding protein [Hyphomicrobiales bacterium]|nr:tripartite tricarboxylate transporter substrate binding protein [Alphaproteobacteria bacterium]
MKRLCWALWIGLAALSVGSDAFGQNYPSQSIRIIVPFPAGGGVDTMARIIGTKLSERIGQPVLIEHRPGAGGNIGADAVAKAPPDGYTLLLTINALAISPGLYRTLPFDPLKSFAPVTHIAASQFILVGSQKMQAATIKDVIALARAKPGSLNYGSSGLGAPLHLLAEMFKHSASLDIMHIPYRGDAPMLTALLSGDVQVAFMPQGTAVPQVQNGQVKGLAITGMKRSTALPELPTLLEAGVKGMEDGTWYGLFAPAGTPREIVLRLQREVAEVVKAPEVLERLRSSGNEPVGSTPEQFDTLYRADIAKYAKIIEDAKIPKLD